MKYKYYIDKNTFINDKQGLKPGVRIKKIPSTYIFNFTNGEGPFDDLQTLKKKSTIYRNVLLRNPKRAQQICLEKNICIVKDFIFAKKDLSIDINFINTLEHITKGRVVKGKVSGVHYYDSERVRILKVIEQNKINGIWSAEIEFFDKKTDMWIRKSNPTTFFPINWSIHQLFYECLHAVNNKQKKIDSKNVYNSKTKSGIKVEIICINGKIKSLYPLLE